MTAICFLLALVTSAPLHYTGGLLGVSAHVTLFPRPARAVIQLQGIPVGGTLNGGASYDSDYKVSLDQDLARKLARLRVHVLCVTPSPEWDYVYVKIRLPLFLGTHTIALARKVSSCPSVLW
jgi:hypothetical protein